MRRLILLALLTLPLYAAISIDAVTNPAVKVENNVSTPLTWTHTVGSGATAMWVGISYIDYYNLQTVSSVTSSCGAQSFTKLDTSRGAGGRVAEGWWLASPTPGSCTITVSVSGAFGSDYAQIKATGITFKGSKTTTPLHGGGTTIGSGSSTAQSYSLTVTAANAYLVGALYTETNAAYSAENTSGQTSIYIVHPSAAGDGIASYRLVGTGVQSLAWTFALASVTNAAVAAFEQDDTAAAPVRRRSYGQ